MASLMRMDDGVTLYVDDGGEGPAVLLVHEFGGDWRSWDAVTGDLRRDHRCIRFSARGFLPSDAPADRSFYGQDRQVRDLLTIADRLGLARFHLVGLSMGSFTSLMFALTHANCITSLTLMGCSSGPANDVERSTYRDELENEIELLDRQAGEGAIRWFANDPAYQRVAGKAPQVWRAYLDRLGKQSVIGAVNTLRTVHWDRMSLYNHESALCEMKVPTLLIHGDEDHSFIAPTNEFLEGTLPVCRRVVLPKTGHLVHIEEPVTVIAELREQFEGL